MKEKKNKNKKTSRIIKSILCISGISISLLVLVVIIISSLGQREGLFLNWGLYFPKPIEINEVYMYDFREGDDFMIWSYESDKFEKLMSNKFEKIDDDNIKIVSEYMNKYRDGLNESSKKMLKETVDIDKLINTDNYYLHKEEKEKVRFLTIIGNSEDNSLYLFNTNH